MALVDSEHFSMDLTDPAFFTDFPEFPDFPDFNFDFTDAADAVPSLGDDSTGIGADHSVQSLPLNLENLASEPVIDPHSGHDDFCPWTGDDFHISADISAFESNLGSSSTPNECPVTVPPTQTISDHVPGINGPLTSPEYSNDGVARNEKPKLKRTKISNESKKIFLQVFQKEPYPSKEDLIKLARSTSIPEQAVKTWFANTRAARSPVISRKRKRSIDGSSPMPRKTAPLSPLTAGSLETLDRASPAPSNVSLERYIDDSLDEAPTAILEKAAKDLSDPKFNPNPNTYNSFNPSRASSVAGSIGSDRSICSVRSMDSRGSRRGRRTWKSEVEAMGKFQRKMPEQPDSDSHASKALKGKGASQYTCTWPGCHKTFTQRFQWARHEEGIHHCPYRWVCGYENDDKKYPRFCYTCVTYGHTAAKHTGTCINKDVEVRTFFREDQLHQHIIRCHPDLKFSIRDVAKSWKTVNPFFSAASLRCGFCGTVSDTWEERQVHVFRHLSKGARKDCWWPERVPRPLLIEPTGSIKCPSCSKTFGNAEEAISTHSRCLTWSCRYLPTGVSSIVDCGSRHYCDLCHTSFTDALAGSSHVGVHALRTCQQEIFSDPMDFVEHLTNDHGALIVPWRYPYLPRWEYNQYLSETR